MKVKIEALLMDVQIGEFKAVEMTFKRLSQKERKQVLSTLVTHLYSSGGEERYYAIVHAALQFLITNIY